MFFSNIVLVEIINLLRLGQKFNKNRFSNEIIIAELELKSLTQH